MEISFHETLCRTLNFAVWICPYPAKFSFGTFARKDNSAFFEANIFATSATQESLMHLMPCADRNGPLSYLKRYGLGLFVANTFSLVASADPRLLNESSELSSQMVYVSQSRVVIAGDPSRPQRSPSPASTSGTSRGPTYTSDPGSLSSLATQLQIPFKPAYVLHPPTPTEGVMEVYGVKGNEIWKSSVTETQIDLKKIGRQVPSADSRLRDYESAIANAEPVLAYEDTQGRLIVILEAGSQLYSVRKMSDEAFGIEHLASSR